MTDIVERLRKQAWQRSGAPKMDAGHTKMLEWEAADEIERLNAKHAQLLEISAVEMRRRDDEIERLKAQVDRYVALLNGEIADNGKLRDEIERLREALEVQII